MKILLVGFTGYWGQKLARAIGELGHKYAGVDSSNVDEIDGTDAEAAIIATPPSTHYELAMRAMNAGLDVLVEKPMAMRVRDAERMRDFAIAGNLVLGIDATFLHTAAFEYLDELDEPLLGYQSIRVSPPMPQARIPAGWDMLVHDVAILDGLVGLDAVGYESSYEDGDIALASLRLHDGAAFMFGSRCWPGKIRDVVLRYPSGTYVWTLEGLKTFDGHPLVQETEEPLKRMLKDFVRRCQHRELRGLTDGQHGVDVVGKLAQLFPDREVYHLRYGDLGEGLPDCPSLQRLPVPHRQSS